MQKLVKPILALLITFTSPVLAGENRPSPRDICRAAGKVYFFMKRLPVAEENGNGWIALTSLCGNKYNCRSMDDTVEFSWINKTGERMRSESTKIEVLKRQFCVVTDMSREIFNWPID